MMKGGEEGEGAWEGTGEEGQTEGRHGERKGVERGTDIFRSCGQSSTPHGNVW
jgi:hypothetical protein